MKWRETGWSASGTLIADCPLPDGLLHAGDQVEMEGGDLSGVLFAHLTCWEGHERACGEALELI